jgi:hypothetical protein
MLPHLHTAVQQKRFLDIKTLLDSEQAQCEALAKINAKKYVFLI